MEDGTLKSPAEKLIDLINRHNSETILCEESCASYESNIAIIALLEQSTDENVDIITPLTDNEIEFYPGELRTGEYIGDTFDRLSIYDPINNFCELNENNGFNWFPRKEKYRIKTEKPHLKEYLIDQELDSYTGENYADRFCTIHIIQNLLIDEVIDFYTNYCHQNGYKVEVKQKATELFEDMLINFSPEKIFYMIAKTVKDIVVYQNKEKIPFYIAKNMLLGSLERYYRKVMVNNWNLCNYKRYDYKKQSWVSYVIFQRIFELPGDGLQYNMKEIAKIMKFNEDELKDSPFSLLRKLI